MAETDLVTAGDSAEQAELPNTVKSEFSSPATPDTPIGAPAAEPTPTTEVPEDSPSGSLSTMVLPELRALANEVGAFIPIFGIAALVAFLLHKAASPPQD